MGPDNELLRLKYVAARYEINTYIVVLMSYFIISWFHTNKVSHYLSAILQNYLCYTYDFSGHAPNSDQNNTVVENLIIKNDQVIYKLPYFR